MKRNRILLSILLLTACGAASARGADVAALAERTGLTERQVRMVLGPPSSYAEYRTSYWIAEHRVMLALSDPNYYFGDEDEDDVPIAREREPAVEPDAAYEERDAETTPLDDSDARQQLQVEDVDDDDGAD